MQLVASIAMIVLGLLLALVLDASADVRAFGWVAVGVGVLGLLALAWMGRPGNGRQRR
jgi:hypothetical protein